METKKTSRRQTERQKVGRVQTVSRRASDADKDLVRVIRESLALARARVMHLQNMEATLMEMNQIPNVDLASIASEAPAATPAAPAARPTGSAGKPVRTAPAKRPAQGGKTIVEFVEDYIRKVGPSTPMKVAGALDRSGLEVQAQSSRMAARNAIRQLVKKGVAKHHPKGGYVIARGK